MDEQNEADKTFVVEKRTIREFVEDLLTDCRTPEHIIMVARNTHWVAKIERVEEILKKVLERVDRFRNNR